jgi:hypothetical protein
MFITEYNVKFKEKTHHIYIFINYNTLFNDDNCYKITPVILTGYYENSSNEDK